MYVLARSPYSMASQTVMTPRNFFRSRNPPRRTLVDTPPSHFSTPTSRQHLSNQPGSLNATPCTSSGYPPADYHNSYESGIGEDSHGRLTSPGVLDSFNTPVNEHHYAGDNDRTYQPGVSESLSYSSLLSLVQGQQASLQDIICRLDKMEKWQEDFATKVYITEEDVKRSLLTTDVKRKVTITRKLSVSKCMYMYVHAI